MSLYDDCEPDYECELRESREQAAISAGMRKSALDLGGATVVELRSAMFSYDEPEWVVGVEDGRLSVSERAKVRIEAEIGEVCGAGERSFSTSCFLVFV